MSYPPNFKIVFFQESGGMWYWRIISGYAVAAEGPEMGQGYTTRANAEKAFNRIRRVLIDSAAA